VLDERRPRPARTTANPTGPAAPGAKPGDARAAGGIAEFDMPPAAYVQSPPDLAPWASVIASVAVPWDSVAVIIRAGSLCRPAPMS